MQKATTRHGSGNTSPAGRNGRRTQLAIIVALMASMIVSAGCEPDTRPSVAISFTWADGTTPPTGTPLWATVLVRRDASSGPAGAIERSSAPTRFDVAEGLSGLQLDLGFGDDRQLVVELRESAVEDQRVVYYGISAPFDFNSDSSDLAVEVQLQPPATETGNTLTVTRPGEDATTSWSEADLVNVAVKVTSTGARWIEIANNATFAGSLRFDAAGNDAARAPVAVCDASSSDGAFCEVQPWDLTLLNTSANPEVFIVYARFEDARGYLSPTIRHELVLDRTAPTVVDASVSAPIVGEDGTFTVFVTTSEPVVEATLTPTPAVSDGGSVVATGLGSQALAFTVELSDQLADFESFALDAHDGAGNALPTTLLASSGGGLVGVRVDHDTPTVCVETLRVVRDGTSADWPIPANRLCPGSAWPTVASDADASATVLADGDRVDFEVRAIEDTELESLDVIFGVESKPCSGLGVTRDCTVTIESPRFASGIVAVYASVSDVVGNVRVEPQLLDFTLDVDPPKLLPLSGQPPIADDRLYANAQQPAVLTARLDEAIDADAVVVTVNGNAAPDAVVTVGTATVDIEFDCAQPALGCSNEALASVTLGVSDVHGNSTVHTLSPWTAASPSVDVIGDDVAPDDATASVAATLTHRRAPWGDKTGPVRYELVSRVDSDASELATVSVYEATTVIPSTCDPAAPSIACVPASEAHFAVDANGCTSNRIASRELGAAISSGLLIDLPSDAERVCVTLTDLAGNESEPVLVVDGELVVTFGDTGLRPPLPVEAWESLPPTLYASDLRIVSPAAMELDSASSQVQGAPSWTQLSSAIQREQSLGAYAPLAYDAARGRLWRGPTCLSPGADGRGCSELGSASPAYFNGHVWIERTPTDPENDGNPVLGLGYAATYDPTRAGVVVVAGNPLDATGEIPEGQTWLWRGTSWQKLEGATLPPLRHVQLVYSTVRRAPVLVGTRADDELPLAMYWLDNSNTWRRESWTGESPLGRPGAAVAFDTATDELVLYGGMPSDSCAGEVNANFVVVDKQPSFAPCRGTWRYDGTSWSVSNSTPSPPAVFGAAMAHDSARQRTVLLGGCSDLPQTADPLATCSNEVWELEGSTWLKRTEPHEAHPSLYAAAAFMPRPAGVVSGGGVVTCADANSGCDWLNVPGCPPIGTALQPWHSKECVQSYPGQDAQRGMWRHGASAPARLVAPASWSPRLANGISMSTLKAPPLPGDGPEGTNDLITYGGLLRNAINLDQTTVVSGETHRWDSRARAWSRLAPASPPPPLYDATFVDYGGSIEGEPEGLILVGGFKQGNTFSNLYHRFEGNEWTEAIPGGGGRAGAAATLGGANSDTLYIFGGYGPEATNGEPCRTPMTSGIPVGSGWCTFRSFDLSSAPYTTFSQTPPPSPAARYGGNLAYLKDTQELVLFGGIDFGLASTNPWPDGQATWVRDEATGDWTRVDPLGRDWPDARVNADLVHSATRESLILFGGLRPFDDSCDGEWTGGTCEVVWEWNGVNATDPSTSPWRRLVGEDDVFGDGSRAEVDSYQMREVVWDDTTKSIIMLSGTSRQVHEQVLPRAELYRWQVDEFAAPAHVFRVPHALVGARTTATNLAVEARAQGQGDSPATSVELSVWQDDVWARRQQTLSLPAGQGGIAGARWDLAVTDGDIFNTADAVHLAVSPQALNGDGREPAILASDYFEVLLEYTNEPVEAP